MPSCVRSRGQWGWGVGRRGKERGKVERTGGREVRRNGQMEERPYTVPYSSHLSTWEPEAGRSLQFHTSLIYLANSRPAKDTCLRDPTPKGKVWEEKKGRQATESPCLKKIIPHGRHGGTRLSLFFFLGGRRGGQRISARW